MSESAEIPRFSRGRCRIFRRLFNHLGRDQRGATSIEFALVAGAFLTLVFLMMDAMWMLAVDMAVNNAAQEASRLGSLGTLQSQTGATPASISDAIKAEMIKQAAGLLASNHLTVTMQSYGGVYNYGHHAANATQASGAGTSRQLVQYIVTYAQPLLTPFAIAALGGQTSFSHTTTIMVQNEPF